MTDAEKKPPIPESNGAYTARELLLSPHLRLVAAGSVVAHDAPPRTIVRGAPARDVRPVDERQLLENQDWDR